MLRSTSSSLMMLTAPGILSAAFGMRLPVTMTSSMTSSRESLASVELRCCATDGDAHNISTALTPIVATRADIFL
jgi:hypothetical protein